MVLNVTKQSPARRISLADHGKQDRFTSWGRGMFCRVPQVPELLHWASHTDPKSLHLKLWHCSCSLAWMTLRDLGEDLDTDEEEGVCQMELTNPQGFDLPDVCAMFLDFYFHFFPLLFLRRKVGRADCAGSLAMSLRLPEAVWQLGTKRQHSSSTKHTIGFVPCFRSWSKTHWDQWRWILVWSGLFPVQTI